MAHKNKVIRSINLPGEQICVDIFQRPEGGFGFDEYRRDPEDGRGWYCIGHHGDRIHGTEDEALTAARAFIPWLNEALS